MFLSKLQRKLQLPSEYREAFSEVYNAKVKLVSTLPSTLLPGDLVTFAYKGSLLNSRTLLVVGTKKAPRGKFTSTQGNYLLCCFEIKQNLDAITMMLNSLYKNRRFSDYSKIPKLLTSFLGISNFKTFKINDIRGAYELEVGENEES
jgi:hypothetical protein